MDKYNKIQNTTSKREVPGAACLDVRKQVGNQKKKDNLIRALGIKSEAKAAQIPVNTVLDHVCLEIPTMER